MPRTKKQAVVEDADLAELEELDDLDGSEDEEEGFEEGFEGFGDDGEDPDEEVEAEIEKATKRSCKPKITDADRLEAYRAGQAAYGRGISAEDWPADLSPDLYRDWSEGWTSGHTEEHQGRGVLIYTPFDPNERDILKLEANYRQFWNGPRSNVDVRDVYPALPWCMEELRGATFRNLHTGSVYHLADRVLPNRNGKPQLVERDAYYYKSDNGDPRRNYLRGVGFWWGERYIVEHDIRVDLWTPAEQIEWFAKEIGRLRDEIARSRESAEKINRNPERYSCASANYNIAVRQMKNDQGRLQGAIQRLHAFAQEHGLPVGADVINGTRYRSREAASRVGEQLQLF